MFGGFFFHIYQYSSYLVLEVYLLAIRILLLVRIHMSLQIQDTLRQMDYNLCYFKAKYQIIVDNSRRGKLVEMIITANI
jgi:hypothetical protein